MKRTLIATALLASALLLALTAKAASDEQDEPRADIEFDTLLHNLGTFTDQEAKQSCTFTFTNTGTAPLVINQAYASCGCTVATYTKEPVQPGETGTVNVDYNGTGKTPGHFKKTISIRSNAVKEVVRLTIEGTMNSSKKQ